ncbi:MAG: CNNM domain-containing protein, partial [Paludibacteraceae bacterium]|nr:CNNM domain-containing protein [Paludibacteraceae bacterium]
MDVSILFDSSADSVPLPEWCAYGLAAFLWLLGSLAIFVFSYCEYFLFSLSDSDKDKILKNDSAGYSGMKRLLNDEKQSLSTLVLGYWCSVAVIVAITVVQIKHLVNSLQAVNPDSASQGPVLTVLMLMGTLVWVLLFADVLPHKISKQNRVAGLYYMSKPVMLAYVILYP